MGRRVPGLVAAALALFLAAPAGAVDGRIVVDLSLGGLRNTIHPDLAIGAGIDGTGHGGVDSLLTARNIKAMRSAGLHAFTYRLRTELGIEAWHWNPEGAWSDAAHQQGYWTSSARLGPPIRTSWGYNLPRRGDTIDQANNAGWSRLDDGDLTTFWKSNPYLDPTYTHEVAGRPEWFVLELGDAQVVDSAEIAWGEPHATRYQVQYWTGADEYDPAGRWVTFPHGAVQAGQGGVSRLSLGASATPTAFVRVLMEEGSGTSEQPSDDPRDRIGFAVREASFGRVGVDGVFHDAIRHAASHDGQSIAHVSSTDPWHRAVDRDPELEQPGLDRVFTGGLANGLPSMVPVPVLYDTPENAAAEIRYLKARHYPVVRVELGEEPDGQYVDAADYGALYLQFADILRGVDPALVMGGPSLQSGLTDTWLDPDPDRSWNSHFIRYLKARGRLADLGFFSFEHYPFDDICGDIYGKLVQQSALMAGLMARVRAEGVPTTIPWLISEYGFSAFSGRAESEMPVALLMANIVGQFLTEGGDGAYLFGYAPNVPINQHQACAGYGNLMLFTADTEGQAAAPMPMFRTARLLTDAWLQPRGVHRLYRANIETAAAQDADLVKAFAARRPDGQLAVMIVNRDPARSFSLTLDAGRRLGAAARTWSYSPRQFTWVDDGPASHPGLNLPPVQGSQPAAAAINILPASITVVVTGLP